MIISRERDMKTGNLRNTISWRLGIDGGYRNPQQDRGIGVRVVEKEPAVEEAVHERDEWGGRELLVRTCW